MTASPAAAADPAWTWADAWVLAAIMLRDGGHGCSLTEVVAAADAIDHSIVSAGEVEQAVRRATGAGLVRASGGRFFLTDDGTALRDGLETAARRGGLGGQVRSLLSALAPLPVTEKEWTLEPGELRAAIGSWNDRADKLMAGG